MTKFFALVAMCISLILTTPIVASVPTVGIETIPPMIGTTVDGSLVCQVDDLNTESKVRLNRWIELNRKRIEGTLTEDEAAEGSLLNKVCLYVKGGIFARVVLLDGLDYLLEVCIREDSCILILTKADGFRRDIN